MPAEQAKRADRASADVGLAELARLTAIAQESIVRDLETPFAALRAEQLLTVLDNVPQGVCLFDRDYRLIFCNRRFAEIYRLEPAEVPPGTTLREIVERRIAAGTGPASAEDYLARFSLAAGAAPEAATSILADGRQIEVSYRPLPDGGWVATHNDVTRLQSEGEVAKDRITLQTLIDWVPDYLWVKDADSRIPGRQPRGRDRARSQGQP